MAWAQVPLRDADAPAAPPVGKYLPDPSAAPRPPSLQKPEIESPESSQDGSLQRLADYGITAEQLAAHSDGSPLESDPRSVDLLLRLLFRLEALPPGNVQRWARPAESLPTLLEARHGELRGLFQTTSGRVERVQQVKLEPRDAERLQFDRYYRCSCVVGKENTPVVVYTRHVPSAWLKEDKLNERIGLTGLYLGRGAPVGGQDALVMVAPRLAWYSDSILGDLGVDVGLLEKLDDAAPIQGGEQEVFYQLLTAVGQTGVSEALRNGQRVVKQRAQELVDRRRELKRREQALKMRVSSLPAQSEEATEAGSELRRTSDELVRLKHQLDRVQTGFSELLPMLEDPKMQAGKMFLVRCLARRILEIKVTDPDIRRRYGLDHYFQIDAIATLEQTVRLKSPRRTADGRIVYETQEMWSHPITFCVRSLPEGLTAGEQVHEEVVVPAFFFKNWSYDTSDLEGGKAPRRVAPLLIAREPIRLLPPPSDKNALAGVLSGILFATVVIGVWIAVWRANRGDRQFEATLFGRQLAGDGAVSLNQLDLNIAEEPNFRHLNQAAAEEVSSSPISGGEPPATGKPMPGEQGA